MSSSNITVTIPWFYDENWNWFMWNIFVWLFPLVCFLGALMNACSFYVIATNHKVFPYVTRQYMLIITMNDFITLALKASTHYFANMSGYLQYNAWKWYPNPRNINLPLCIIYDFFTYYTILGAPFYQLGLTIDRLIAVAVPLKAKFILNRRRSWILLFIITLMALMLPTMFVIGRTWNSVTKKCDFWDYNYYILQVYAPSELYFGRVFLLSALVIGTVAIGILLLLRNRATRKMKLEAGSESSNARNRSLIRVTLILIFINVLFFLTSVPYSIVSQLEIQLKQVIGETSYMILLRHLNTVLYLNSALNWLFFFMGRNFRSAYLARFAPCGMKFTDKRTHGYSPDGNCVENPTLKRQT